MRLLKIFIPLIILLLSPVAISDPLSFFNEVNGSNDIKLVKEILSHKEYTIYINGENIQIEEFIDNYGDTRFENLPKVKTQGYKRSFSFQSLNNSIVIDKNGQVTMLNMKYPDLSELTYLNKFKNLESLYIYGLESNDLLDLSELKNLKYLDLRKNKSKEISLPKGSNLKTISISYSGVVNLVGLNHSENLESLEVAYTKIKTLGSLNNLLNIKRLDILSIGKDFKGQISLGASTDLEFLAVYGINISKTNQLENMNKLRYLALFDVDKLDDVELPQKLESLMVRGSNSTAFPQIENCENLNFLMITDTKFTSVPDLKRLTKLKEVKLENNQLNDISGLSNLANLEELYLKDNNISQISDLAGLKKLRLLDLEDNQIKSVSGLKDMPSLKAVNFENNPVESVDFEMVDQFKGVMFNISETPFHETSTLEQRKRMGMYY